MTRSNSIGGNKGALENKERWDEQKERKKESRVGGAERRIKTRKERIIRRVGRRHKVRIQANNQSVDHVTRQHVEQYKTTMSSFRKPNNMCVNVGVWLSFERLREREGVKERDRKREREKEGSGGAMAGRHTKQKKQNKHES